MVNKPKIYIHGSYVGTTGYNNHTRDFFRELSKHLQLKVRNFTIGKSWTGFNETPHDGEKYLDDLDKSILYEQVLWNNDKSRSNYKIYPNKSKEFQHDLNLVLCESDHYLFYDGYSGPKIAYNVWESTKQPEEFFEKLKEYDELWVPSKWQKECTIKQGYPEDKIKVVPEGVDVHTFYPEETTHELTSDGRFKFFLAGRWDYRKSTKEIIETFLNTFDKNDPVDLIVSIDNAWGDRIDNFKTTEERLEYFGLVDPRIKIVHFPPREEYIKILKSCNVFLSCARSEGWNLPLIEAMACGVPSIYSNCSGQLEFAQDKGIPVNILGKQPTTFFTNEKYRQAITTSEIPGEYYEPDFNHLQLMMMYSYTKYDECKKNALKESEEIRRDFSWEKVGEIGYKTLMDFHKKHPFIPAENKIKISYLEGPKVEIVGDNNEQYHIEFLDKNNNIIHEDTITNNMWTKCSRTYYTEWKIKVNGIIIDEFNLVNKRVLICLDSKSIGDTLAWAPYAVEFAKKHNCKVILSTFHNYWFKELETYKDIEFLEPGQSIGCDVKYQIGWFRGDLGKWDKFEMYPNQVNLIPLQQTATDILGLDFKEINHGIDLKIGPRPKKKKYIVFGPQATSGCKEWTYNNWKSLAKMLKQIGYDIVVITGSEYKISYGLNLYGKSWDEVATYLHYAEAFIGLGSGLSWINWALGNHTYMINGFVKEGHEFTSNLTKITNDLCIKCWNDPVHVFDSSDWDWCPVYKGTELQHICQKSITPLQVFNILKL